MAASAEVVVEEVKASVQDAAARLASLGAEYERIAWLLEDALLLLSDPATDSEFSVGDILEAERLESERDQQSSVVGKLVANG